MRNSDSNLDKADAESDPGSENNNRNNPIINTPVTGVGAKMEANEFDAGSDHSQSFNRRNPILNNN